MELVLKNITHSFGGHKIFHNMSFDFLGGNIYSILGSNGVGKTTLLNIINGFTNCQNGEIVLNGINISKLSVHKRSKKYEVIRFWQNAEIFKNLSVLENLLIVNTYLEKGVFSYFAKTKRIKRERKIDIEKAKTILTELGLLGKENEFAENLSFGQQRLLAFGRILMDKRIEKGNTLILIDEPFAGVHSTMIDFISNKIQEFAKLDNLVLLIEHNFKRIESISDKILVIENNKLNLKQ